MRISDERYSRERLCLDLALRFLRHEARTQTIRTWTGLTDDRIRNLYRSYMSRGALFVPRHRGKSPHLLRGQGASPARPGVVARAVSRFHPRVLHMRLDRLVFRLVVIDHLMKDATVKRLPTPGTYFHILRRL